jgi:predicted amidophosphoribosyltransferase
MKLINLAELGLFLLTRCIACDVDSPGFHTFPLCFSCENALLPGLNIYESFSDSIESRYSLFQLTDSAYPVLRRWKTRRGPLFDQRVLNRVDLGKLKNHIFEKQIQAIIPVPQGYLRSWKMGGSPVLVLSQFVSSKTGVLINPSVLSRLRPFRSKRQAELSGWQRQQTKLHFKVGKNRLGIQSVLLVDDFSTTGHTLDAAASALKKAGYGKIHTLCLGSREPGVYKSADCSGAF